MSMSTTEMWLRLREETEAHREWLFAEATRCWSALGDQPAALRHREQLLERATGAGWVLDKMRELDGTPRRGEG
jgi:hypothetical protein